MTRYSRQMLYNDRSDQKS